MSVSSKRAWENLNNLSYVRVTGSPEELKAAQYLKEQCEKNGVEAHLESYEIDMPKVTYASFTVLEPEEKTYPCIGVSKSGDTGEEGICAGFAYVENVLDVNLCDVKGKICLVNEKLRPNFTEKLVKAGAVGTITIVGNFLDEKSLQEELRPQTAFGKGGDLPGLVMHISEAEKLIRSKPTKVKMIMTQNKDKKGTSQNVVATIEGTDLKDEIVTFSAHYDSVPYSRGVWDNATGSVTILEIMHYFKENRPRRTVKFVWCGSEEIGLVGSKNYCESHPEEMKNTIFNMNFDMTGVTVGYESCCVSGCNEVLHAIEYLSKLESTAVKCYLGAYSSDSSSFAIAGVPSCTFARLTLPGGAQIHNHNDTIEHLDPDSFMITLNFSLTFAKQLVNTTTNIIPRKFEKEVQEKLDERKRWSYRKPNKSQDKQEKSVE